MKVSKKCIKPLTILLQFSTFCLSAFVTSVITVIAPAVLVSKKELLNTTNNSSFNLTNNEPVNEDNVKIGILFGIKGLIQVFANPIYGYIIDKSTPLSTTMIALVMDSTAALVYAFAKTYPMFFVARILNAFGCAAAGCSAFSAISINFSKSKYRAKLLGALNCALLITVSLSPFYGGAIHQFVGQKLVFLSIYPFWWILGLMSIPLWMDYYYQCIIKNVSHVPDCDALTQGIDKTTLQQNQSQNNDEEIYYLSHSMNENDSAMSKPEPSETKVTPTSIYRLLMDPYIILVAIGIAVANTSIFCLMPTLPLYMRKKYNAQEYEQGIVWTPGLFFHIFGTFVAGLFCHRWSDKSHIMVIISFICSSGATFALLYAPKWYWVIIPLGVNNFTFAVSEYALLPLLSTLVDERHTAAYGSISAIIMGSISLANSLSAFMSGPIVRTFGFEYFIVGISILTILYAPSVFLLRKYWK